MLKSRNLSPKLLTAILLLLLTASIANISYASEDYVPDELIVKLKNRSDETRTLSHFGSRGAVVRKSFKDLNMMVIQLSPGDKINDAQAALRDDPDVEYVEKNYYVHAHVNPNDPRFGQQTYMGVIDTPQAWDTETGDPNVVIAVLDTGVQPSHEDLSGKLLPGCNVLGSFNESSCGSNTSDLHGHGTGVAGTAAASTNNSRGVAGVCWSCQILPVKVLGDTGSGSVSDAVEGILYARNYALSNPAKRVVINMSLGRDCQSSGVLQSEQDAIDAAWNAGVLIVASAGNDGNSNLQCPASANHVIAVSATTNADAKASFSSFGSFIDLAAPGVNIMNALGKSSGSSYAYWSGTSFSAPIVSGVAGLVWSVNTSRTNAQVDKILRDSAENIGSSTFFGDGRVNAEFAVALASGNPAPSPTPAPTPGPGVPSPTPPPPASKVLSIKGLDPGTAGAANKLIATGAASGATVKFYYSTAPGSTSITSGVCKGKSLSLRRASLLGSARADSSGTATLNISLKRTLGGRTLYTQSLAQTSSTCAVSNRVSQKIKSSPRTSRTPSRRTRTPSRWSFSW